MRYLVGRLHGGDVAGIGSQPEGADGPAAWNTYVWVDSADETAAKVAEAGGSVLMEPFDVSDAGRMAAFADPAGAAFCVWQAKAGRGAQIVNEPGQLELQRPQHPRPRPAPRRSTARSSAGRRPTSRSGASFFRAARRTATTSRSAIPACASG